ncbi:MAG: MlaE family ABC transporter permease [Steroidobacteraceae bacterium]
MPAARSCAPAIEIATSGQQCTARLTGPWTLTGLRRRFEPMRRQLAALACDRRCCWDLRDIETLDSIGAFLLWQAWKRCMPGTLLMRETHRALFEQWTRHPPIPAPPPARLDVWGALTTLIARHVHVLFEHLCEGVWLVGQLALDALYLLRHPRRIPWREVSATVYQAGTRALGLTALVGALIGLVVSYLSSIELRAYGAQSFIVDIVGLGVVRELGPMLAAILVAGRSGSSMTAQLGVMRLTQELDALTAMGISPTVRLVLPKVLALLITMPLLVVWTDALALAGGMVAAKAQLGLGFLYFLGALPGAVPLVNLWIGLGKGAVFGVLVGLTAGHFGLRIEPNSESLGLETTQSVVTSITLVILIDAAFAVLLRNVGLQ